MGGQGGCERKIEVFEKFHQKKNRGGGLVGVVRVGGGGSGRGVKVRVCSGWGVRMDVNEELKFL